MLPLSAYICNSSLHSQLLKSASLWKLIVVRLGISTEYYSRKHIILKLSISGEQIPAKVLFYIQWKIPVPARKKLTGTSEAGKGEELSGGLLQRGKAKKLFCSNLTECDWQVYARKVTVSRSIYNVSRSNWRSCRKHVCCKRFLASCCIHFYVSTRFCG